MRGTLLERFLERARQHGDRVATVHTTNDRQVETTWSVWDRRSRTLASALVALGLRPGDRVAILSPSRIEWAWIDLAIMMARCISVPIFSTETDQTCAEVLQATGARLAIAASPRQAAKLVSAQRRGAPLERAVMLDSRPGEDPESREPVVDEASLRHLAPEGWLLSMEGFLDLGEGALPETTQEVGQRIGAVKPGDVATICLTPGTEEEQKCVAITHGNIEAASSAIAVSLGLGTRDVHLLYLPLAHAFGRLTFTSAIAAGVTTAFARSHRTVLEDCQVHSPTYLCAVPRFFDTIRVRMESTRRRMPAVQRAAVQGALKLAERSMESGEPEGVLGGLNRNVVEQLVEAPLQSLLGGQLRFAISGGAPLPLEAGSFFRLHGIEVLEGYGLTETFATSHLNRFDDNDLGTVGFPVGGMECKVDEEGEILLRGPSVSPGLWGAEAGLRSHLEDGWFRTGDLGSLDASGRLRITDRKRDVIITANGKAIAPQAMAAAIRSHPLVAQVLIHGDGRNYLTALVTLDRERASFFALDAGLKGLTFQELVRHPVVYDSVDGHIAEVNAQSPAHAAVRKFAILEDGIAASTGEVAPMDRLRRRAAEERHRRLLDSFYQEQY